MLRDKLMPETSEDYPAVGPYPTHSRLRRQQRIADGIRHVFVPLSVMRETSLIMGDFAAEQRECYVWWGGYCCPVGLAHVTTAYCPAIRTAYGEVHLHRQALHALHQALRKRDQILVAELHTHPPLAGGQNEVDAANAAAPFPGFITIVVPAFGLPLVHDLRRCHVYRYLMESKWTELAAEEIEQTFTIEEQFVRVAAPEPS